MALYLSERTKDFLDFVGVDMQIKRNRLLSLQNFPHDFIRKTDLADAGFFYYGEDDKVECFICGLNIGEWTEGNIPREEHEKHSPDCRWLKGLVVEAVNYPEQVVACHPTMSTFTERIKTFESWPNAMSKLVKPLAEAGFFYVGTGDSTKCFFCSGLLDSWVPEATPWERHALFFPYCEYVRILKGVYYIINLKFKNNSNSRPVQLEPSNKFSDVNKSLCVLCRKEKRTIVFKPCGHASVCTNCVPNDNICPVCDLPFSKAVKFFLPGKYSDKQVTMD